MSESVNFKPYYVYILRCMDDSLYTGITSDLERRMKAHCGKIKGGAKYTRSHPVKSIEAAWKAESRSAALRAEHILKKRLTRSEKLMLISEPERLCSGFIPELAEYGFEVCGKDILSEICSKALSENDIL